MAIVDRCCQSSLLYIGTTTGVIIVAEADAASAEDVDK